MGRALGKTHAGRIAQRLTAPSLGTTSMHVNPAQLLLLRKMGELLKLFMPVSSSLK